VFTLKSEFINIDLQFILVKKNKFSYQNRIRLAPLIKLEVRNLNKFLTESCPSQENTKPHERAQKVVEEKKEYLNWLRGASRVFL